MGQEPQKARGAELLVVDDPVFDEHAATSNHPERPARLDAARSGLARAGVATLRPPAKDVDRALLERVHDPSYLETLDRLRGARGMIDSDTYVAPRSVEAAHRAAGAAQALAEGLLDGLAHTGVAMVRPPGHHAESGRAMGFCLLNNAAVAAMAAHRRGVERVAIVDIDVHHGNGTQAIFLSDPDTLYISIHQFPFYPGTGSMEERGVGEGQGATVNIPLSEGANDPTYGEATRTIVVPTLLDFHPGLVLISAGFDAYMGDPLASMVLTPDGYSRVVSAIVDAGDQLGAPVGMVLEGGYDLMGIESCMAGAARALLGEPPAPRSAEPPIARVHRGELKRAREAAEVSGRERRRRRSST